MRFVNLGYGIVNMSLKNFECNYLFMRFLTSTMLVKGSQRCQAVPFLLLEARDSQGVFSLEQVPCLPLSWNIDRQDNCLTGRII